MNPSDAKAQLAARELSRRSYYDYLTLVHGSAWVHTRLSRYLAREIQTFLETDTGNAYDILVIHTPPQHGKSITVTESLPSWVLGRWPEKRIILGSYNDDSAQRFARRNKEKVKKWGKVLFGIEIGGVDRSDEFELKGHRGGLISRGIRAGVTGNSAEVLILDDPIKNRQEADSPAYRRELWEEWVNSFKSRLGAKAKVILIMTPWHEGDMGARVLETEEHVRCIRLAVAAEAGDELGRAEGEPLCPELGKDKRWLADFQKSYLADPQGGQRAWSALYLCRPRAEGGNLVKRHWWRFYDAAPPMAVEIISVDAAFKGGEGNDFVAITVWGKRGSDYYLKECVNRHLDFTQTLREIRAVQRRFPNARTVLIEDKANGSAIINVLQRELFCIAVEPKGGKIARVHAVSPAIESGHVLLPRNAPWVGEYLEQWCAFPAGKHDDMVDSSTQGLSYLFTRGGELPAAAVGEEPWDEYRVYG